MFLTAISSGTVSAVTLDIVKSVRTALSAMTLLVAMTATATVPAFAGLLHPVCASTQHDCGQTPKIVSCCCGDEHASPTESTPVQSRVQIRADFSSMPAVTSALQVAMTPHARTPVHTSPPNRGVVDLPTLFSSLLI
jgi:hypothetical protein